MAVIWLKDAVPKLKVYVVKGFFMSIHKLNIVLYCCKYQEGIYIIIAAVQHLI